MFHTPETPGSQRAFLRILREVLRGGSTGRVQRHAGGGSEWAQEAVEKGRHCGESHEDGEGDEDEMMGSEFQRVGWFCGSWRRLGEFYGYLYIDLNSPRLMSSRG